MTEGWTHDKSSALWEEQDESEKEKWPEPFFHDLKLEPIEQIGKTCVPTSLAVVARGTGADVGPDDFKHTINTQSPHTWSTALAPFGMQLAYCSHDARFLECYIEELIEYDDLFLLCFYAENKLREKPEGGVFGGSHVVTLYRDRIIDTNDDKSVEALKYRRRKSRTKRIFRVIPKGHPRCV
jgi:hypothetical protein